MSQHNLHVAQPRAATVRSPLIRRIWGWIFTHGRPEILRFEHDDRLVVIGGEMLLSWEVRNAAWVRLMPFGVDVPSKGRALVPVLAEHREWTLLARSRGGSTQEALLRPSAIQPADVVDRQPSERQLFDKMVVLQPLERAIRATAMTCGAAVQPVVQPGIRAPNGVHHPVRGRVPAVQLSGQLRTVARHDELAVPPDITSDTA